MKRIFSLLAVAAICAGLLSCASSPARNQPGSSVWEISKDGNALFLGGSVHILRETDYPLPKEFDRAFSRSAALVLETDVEQMADESINAYLMTKVTLPDDQTLQTILDADAYEALEAKLGEYGIPISLIAEFKPSVAILMLSMLQIEEYGFVQEGIDAHYLQKAKDKGKPVYYLETVQAQIDMIATMGDGYESDYVRYSLQDMEDTETGFEELLAEWKTGGSSNMEASLAEMKEQWPTLYSTMVSDRNAAWMPQITKYLNSGTVFFVIVGVGHLHGPDGLLRQLEDSGYAVEQVNRRR